jgi:hypothetical protein
MMKMTKLVEQNPLRPQNRKEKRKTKTNSNIKHVQQTNTINKHSIVLNTRCPQRIFEFPRPNHAMKEQRRPVFFLPPPVPATLSPQK